MFLQLQRKNIFSNKDYQNNIAKKIEDELLANNMIIYIEKKITNFFSFKLIMIFFISKSQ